MSRERRRRPSRSVERLADRRDGTSAPLRRRAVRASESSQIARHSAPHPRSFSRERDGLLVVGDEMSAEDGADAGGVAGALELDGAVDAVGIGAGERPVAPLRGRGREHLGARDADPEGEVSVEMEVDHGCPCVSVFVRVL